MTVNVTTVLDDVLKRRWLSEQVQDHAWRRHSILRDLKSVRKDFSGKNPQFTIQTYPGEEGVFLAEDGDINLTATDEGYEQGYFSYKTMATTRTVSIEALEDAKNSAGSLVRPAIALPKAVIDAQVFHISRNTWCDQGKLANCITSGSDATYELATNSNMRRFRRNMTVDVIDAADDASAVAGVDSNVIQSIDETTPALVLTDSATTDTNDVVCFEDEAVSSSGDYSTRAWNGLPNLVGTGSCCNITVSTTTNPEYKAKVVTSTGTLTLQKMQNIVDYIEAISQRSITKIYMSPECAGKYGGLLIPDMRFTPELLNRMEGGQVGTNLFFKGGSMGTIPIQRDQMMPLDEIYFITWPSFQLATTAWLKWMNMTGTMYHWVTPKLKLALIMYSRGEFGVLLRNANGKMTGVTI